MTYKLINNKLVKKLKPSYWMYFQEEEAYKDEFSIYGETFLKDGAEDYADAFTKIEKGRVTSGHGKWARVKLGTGRVKLVKVLDVSAYAKKYNLFSQKQKIDDFLVSQVTSEEERDSGGESVTITAQELHDRIKDYIDNDSKISLEDQFEYSELPCEPVLPRLNGINAVKRAGDHISDLALFKARFNYFCLEEGFDVTKAADWTDAEFKRFRKLSKNFIQLWCCGGGKSTTPILVYEMCMEILWNFKESFPINLVTSPTLKVLTGNLITLASNSIAKNRQEKHVVFAGIDKDKGTLAYLRSLGIEVISDRTQFVKLMKEWTKTHTVWVHTTYQSYYYQNNKQGKKEESRNCLTRLMRELKRSFYFAYIDEVHKTWQPNRKPWSAIHYDDLCRIENRFKCTASKKDFKGPSSVTYKKEWHVGKYNDVEFPRLTINQAVRRGYIRNYEVLDFLIRQELLDTLLGKKDIVEVIYKKRMPWVKAAGTNISVPFSYWASAITQLYIRYSGVAAISHTLAVVNQVKQGVLYKEFFNAIKPQLVDQLCNGNIEDPMYDRLMKVHCDVMDTHKDADSVRIFKRIDQIPLQYDDSIIIHCYVAEVGWNPGSTLTKKQQEKYKGFIDSVTFIEKVGSADRIQQNCGRGARLAKMTASFKNTCYLILNHLVDYNDDGKNPYNKRYDYTKMACRALEIGKEELKQKVRFFDASNLGSGGGGGTDKGDKHNTAMFVTGDISGVDAQWMRYMKNGDHYTPLFETTEKIIDDYEVYCKLNNYQSTYVNTIIWSLGFGKWAQNKYKGCFSSSASNNTNIIRAIITNNHHSVDVDQTQRLYDIEDKIESNNTQLLKDFETKFTLPFVKEVNACIDNNTVFAGSSTDSSASWLAWFMSNTGYNFYLPKKDILTKFVNYKLPEGKLYDRTWQTGKITIGRTKTNIHDYVKIKILKLTNFYDHPEVIKTMKKLDNYLITRRMDINAKISAIMTETIKKQPYIGLTQETYSIPIKKMFNIGLNKSSRNTTMWEHIWKPYKASSGFIDIDSVKNQTTINTNTVKIYKLIAKLAESGKCNDMKDLAQKAYDLIPSLGLNVSSPNFTVNYVRSRLMSTCYFKKHPAFIGLSQDDQNNYVSTLKQFKSDTSCFNINISTPHGTFKSKVDAQSALGLTERDVNQYLKKDPTNWFVIKEEQDA